MSFNLDQFLKEAENKVNPNLSKHINEVPDGGDKMPDIDPEKYVDEKPKDAFPDKEPEPTKPIKILIEDDYEFDFEDNEKVEEEELEEALAKLYDPGYEKDVTRFYAKLVDYNRTLCQPILDLNTFLLGNIGMLQNPIEMFLERKKLRLMTRQVRLLQEIKELLQDETRNEKSLSTD